MLIGEDPSVLHCCVFVMLTALNGRHFHANQSESAAGLNEMNIASAREASRMFRMREAKELAGL